MARPKGKFMTWRPLHARTRWVSGTANPIKEGDVIALQFNAWRIDRIDINDAGTVMRLTRAFGDSELTDGEIGPLGPYVNIQVYDDGRVPLCSCHHHPFPCREMEAERVAADEFAIMEQRMARAGLDDVCYACGEAISSRQGSITYPAAEGHVQLPGYPAPSFHTRDRCFDGRYSYAKDRAKILPFVPLYDPSMERHLTN